LVSTFCVSREKFPALCAPIIRMQFSSSLYTHPFTAPINFLAQW
jgi:hypothetical protein